MRAWRLALLAVAAAGWVWPGAFARAQDSSTPATPPPASSGDDGFSVRNTRVGYIDSAVLANEVRVRFDAGYDFNRPNRAEFFYSQNAFNFVAFPHVDTLDYQELNVYGEAKLTERLSGFLEAPLRWVNPEEDPNSFGPSDVSFGGKFSLYSDEMVQGTFQLRVTVPTGDVNTGLGTGHVSVEPALLFCVRGLEGWGVEGELRYWVPIGGTDFAGDVVRYGLGVHYDLYQCDQWSVAPVLEFVGWTVLGGKDEPLPPLNALPASAAGQTIVNGKLGVRVGFGEHSDVYLGYGRALTGDRWYHDVLRAEYRWAF
jgi:hypothetical protein